MSLSSVRGSRSGWGPWLRNAGLAAGTVVVASMIGNFVTLPHIPTWYAGLVKPSFNPPNWLFGPVWTLLFAMMAWSVFRILQQPAGTPGRSRALTAYWVQLVLNPLWSIAFFGLTSPLLGLVVIVPFLAAILVTIAWFWPLDRLASGLLWPYAAWVSFATLLNAAIWWLNR
jgi:tryptophan-rich sensory protein